MGEPDRRRRPEIDFLKGVACALMLFGHAVRLRMGAPLFGDKLALYLFDFSGPIFFFMSGMNVMTFIERNGRRPDFAATKFYLAAAAALFLFGYSYNLNRYTFLQIDIFQGIAICTAVVYLLMRTKLPVWAHFLAIAASYFVYLAFRMRLELNVIVPKFHELRVVIGPDASLWDPIRLQYSIKFWQALPPLYRYGYLHFTPLFWIVFVYVGALCHRSLNRRPQRQVLWLAFFAACFLGGPFAWRNVFAPGAPLIEALYFRNNIELFLRGIPSFVLTTLGASGLMYLFCRRFYRGAAACRRRAWRWCAARLEFFGRESLMFLVVHWLMITLATAACIGVEKLQRLRGVEVMVNFYLRGTLALAATLWALPRFVRWRDHWWLRPMFARDVVAAMLVGLALFFWGLFIGRGVVAYTATFPVSIGFAFLFPEVRDRLRRRFTARPPAPG